MSAGGVRIVRAYYIANKSRPGPPGQPIFPAATPGIPANRSVHGLGCAPKKISLQVLGEVFPGLLVRLYGNDDSGLVVDHFDDRGQLGAVDSRLGMPEL